jgi:hypothetical protein
MVNNTMTLIILASSVLESSNRTAFHPGEQTTVVVQPNQTWSRRCVEVLKIITINTQYPPWTTVGSIGG